MTGKIWRLLYNCAALPLLWTAAKAASWKNEKIRLSFRRRKRLWARLEKHLRKRDFSRPLIWFHAASAGEFLQSQPLMEIFLENGYQACLTFNSVSAEKWVKGHKFDDSRAPLFMDYLPLDFASSIKRWIGETRPAALILVRSELWPNTVWQADESGVPMFLISAALPPKSFRYSSNLARSFYGDLYSRFRGVFSVSEEDRRRFMEKLPSGFLAEVAGDTRFDSVINRRDRLSSPPLPDYMKEKVVFVAGSVWPPDEKCVFPGLKKALLKYENLVLIIAPHEPDSEHLKEIASYFADFQTALLSKVNEERKRARIVLVDSVGVLSLLYRAGNVAYVGGGFTTGVHNVMEPAAMGLPVVCGPFHHNSGEALHLIGQGSGFAVKEPEEFEKLLFRLLDNLEETEKLGMEARKYIESQSGSARRCFEVISGELKQLQQLQVEYGSVRHSELAEE